MALTSPGEAAKLLGISEAMLRQLAGEGYYGRWIEAESPGQGGRRGRMYTERDMALLRYVVRTEKRGTPHKRIKQDLEEYGLDAVLRTAIAAEDAVPALTESVERLRLEVAKAHEERDGLQRAKQQLEAAMEQQRQQMEASQAGVEAELSQARALHSQVRAGALVISRQVEIWKERVQANLNNLGATRARLQAERAKVNETIASAEGRIATLKGWILDRGAIRAEMREARVRLERIEEVEREISAVENAMMMVIVELQGNLGRFRETSLLQGPAEAVEEDLADSNVAG